MLDNYVMPFRAFASQAMRRGIFGAGKKLLIPRGFSECQEGADFSHLYRTLYSLCITDSARCRMVGGPIRLFAGIWVEGIRRGPRVSLLCHGELWCRGFAVHHGRGRVSHGQCTEPGHDGGCAEENEATDQDGDRASRGDAAGQEGVTQAGDADHGSDGGGRAEQRMLNPGDGRDDR